MRPICTQSASSMSATRKLDKELTFLNLISLWLAVFFAKLYTSCALINALPAVALTLKVFRKSSRRRVATLFQKYCANQI